MVSPGGEAQSGANEALCSVMVVSYELDADCGHSGPIDVPILVKRVRTQDGREHQAMAPRQIQRDLASPISRQRVRSAGLQLGNTSRRLQVAQARPQLPRTVRSEPAFGADLFLAERPKPCVPEADFHAYRIVIWIYLSGKSESVARHSVVCLGHGRSPVYPAGLEVHLDQCRCTVDHRLGRPTQLTIAETQHRMRNPRAATAPRPGEIPVSGCGRKTGARGWGRGAPGTAR